MFMKRQITTKCASKSSVKLLPVKQIRCCTPASLVTVRVACEAVAKTSYTQL